MQPSLELLREWEACLMMEDIALTIRSSIALLESINSYAHMLPVRSAHFVQWSDRHHELAELADKCSACLAPRNLSPARLPLLRQACLSQSRNATHHTASGSRPTVFMLKHARRPMCAACRTATKIVHRILCQLLVTPRALNARNQGVDTPRHADFNLLT